MDTVFLYKELHKINLLMNPDHKFHETIAVSIESARKNVIHHRDALMTNEHSNSASHQQNEDDNIEQEVLCNEDIIHRIMGRATVMGIQVYPRDLNKLTSGELQEELSKIILKDNLQKSASTNKKSVQVLTQEVLPDNDIIHRIMDYAASLEITVKLTDLQRLTTSELQQELEKLEKSTKNCTPVEKKGRAYEELDEKEKQAQNLFGVNPSQFDPSPKSKASTATNTNVPPPKEKDINEEAASAVKTTRVEIFL